MQSLIQILTITIKELRELLHRPWQALTLIIGPLALMIVFGIGSDTSANPPRTLVVIPSGQEPRLLQDYQRQFEQFLNVVDYTADEAAARIMLERNVVEAVVILPPTPYETIAGGEQATIRVLYNQIDPLWRWVVPNFTQVMVGEINRELFLQNVTEQQRSLSDATIYTDLVVEALNLAIDAADRQERTETLQHLQTAQENLVQLDDALAELGPEAQPLSAASARLQQGLEAVERRLSDEGSAEPTPNTASNSEQLGLIENRQRIQQLRETLGRFVAVSPEVVISPLQAETTNLARLEPDIVTFFAPNILALLTQHIAVSMGALALVRERLAGSFDLYAIAPLSVVELLLGKYLAYMLFTLTIAAVVVATLLVALQTPLLGSAWRMTLTLFLLALAAVGLGFALSLLATSERQAVQFSMLSLLAIVFFSGFTLPLSALRQPALAIAYLVPATYGTGLLQDVMLRGAPGDTRFFMILGAIAVGLFAANLVLLHRRTRAR